LGLSVESDKERFAASRVMMDDLRGRLLSPEEVLADLRSCALLGILWQELRPSPAVPAPDHEWWDAFFSLLAAAENQPRSAPGGLRLQMTPSVARSLSLTGLRSLGILCIDLGVVDCSDPEAVDEASAAIRATRRAGLDSQLTALLGEPGGVLSDEERGLRELTRSGALVDAQLRVLVGETDPAAWASWLEAPNPTFIPPGTDPERLHLVERTRADRRRQLESAPRSQALARRIRDFLETRWRRREKDGAL